MDVVMASARRDDPSQVVDQTGADNVIGTRFVSQADLIALVLGLLVVGSTIGLLTARTPIARRAWGRWLVGFACASVVALAAGGHEYALLVPLAMLAGASAKLARPARSEQPDAANHRAARPLPPSTTVRRRPSPRSRTANIES
jgi:hypothetical protein